MLTGQLKVDMPRDYMMNKAPSEVYFPSPPTPPPPPPPPPLPSNSGLSSRTNSADTPLNPSQDSNGSSPPFGCVLHNGATNVKDIEGKKLLRSKSPNSGETIHVVSRLYAQLLLVSCAVLVFSEVLHLRVPLLYFHGYLFTYLIGGAIVCLIGVYVSMLVDKCPKLTGSTPKPESLGEKSDDISLFLRIGALVFGLGTLISACLEIAMIFSMTQPCTDDLNLAQPILRGLFTFLQLHFFFLNTQEVQCSLGWFRHLALMHLLATNLALWVRLVLWEAAKDWLMSEHVTYNSTERWPPKDLNFTIHAHDESGKHLVYYTSNCWWKLLEREKPEDMLSLFQCLQNSTIGAIWHKSLPFLYPFIVQYCLLGAAVVFVLWTNINNKSRPRKSITSLTFDPETKAARNYFKIDCQKSSKGLFLGLLVLVAGVIVLILYFVLSNEKSLHSDTLFSIVLMHCGILGLSFVGTVIGLFQIRHFRVKAKHKSDLTTVLQNTTILAVYIYAICNIIIGGSDLNVMENILLFVDGILMVLQAFTQTLFIHHVSRRQYACVHEIKRPMGGHQVIIFLVFSNMALWLMESFTTQNSLATQLQILFYGEIPWSIISKFALPLITFYRFHSLASLMESSRHSSKSLEDSP